MRKHFRLTTACTRPATRTLSCSSRGLGGRVMPGVRLLGRSKEFYWMNAGPQRMAQRSDSSVTGHEGRPSLGEARWREA